MGTRRESRECALQFLFQYDLNPAENLDEAIELYWSSRRRHAVEQSQTEATWGQAPEIPAPNASETTTRLFADPLIRGTLEHQAAIDAIIQRHARNWALDRMAVVDRNVLRLAIYEMHHRQDIPPVVSINEAVDIAKKFSTTDSGKFVNGILDKVRLELMRPSRDIP